MKTLIFYQLLFCLVALTNQLSAQTYTFSAYQEDYVSLGSGFPLTEGVWDDPNYTVPVGFEFQFFDRLISDLHSSEDFTTGGALITNFINNKASVIGVFGPDLIDRGSPSGSSQSAIYFDLSGTPGQRVFTQEWLNAGFFAGDIVNDTYVDFVNFQLRIYEASGDIVFHYGPSSISNPAAVYEGNPGPAVGLFKNFEVSKVPSVEEVILLSGDPANPTLVNVFEDVYLNGTIPENTVYRFSRVGTAVKDEFKTLRSSFFYPSPTDGKLFIQQHLADGIQSPVQVFNTVGMLVKKVAEPSDLSLDDLSPGLYEIRFQTNNGWHAERIVNLY
jgi:hypothetical protein